MADQELGPIATHELWADVYDRIAAHARAERTTIVFVNTRRLVERVAHQLEERLGQGRVAAHHGRMARRLRLEAEERLKSGAVPVVVATASLAAGDAGPMRLARQLLRRYGVATRELTARESRVTSWRALLGALRTLEARPRCETLRAVRRRHEPAELVIVAAADPLNLVGILLPGPRLPATAREVVAFRDGVPVESGDLGAVLSRLGQASPGLHRSGGRATGARRW